ncbi:MAG: hypothetical protein DBX90_15235 [Lentisphaerae bacterium]|nr:MAG: hypothetical protein DBX90_15235 [Lentisphaerota bacterium]
MTDEIFSAVRFSFSATGIFACRRCFSGRNDGNFSIFSFRHIDFYQKMDHNIYHLITSDNL